MSFGMNRNKVEVFGVEGFEHFILNSIFFSSEALFTVWLVVLYFLNSISMSKAY